MITGIILKARTQGRRLQVVDQSWVQRVLSAALGASVEATAEAERGPISGSGTASAEVEYEIQHGERHQESVTVTETSLGLHQVTLLMLFSYQPPVGRLSTEWINCWQMRIGAAFFEQTHDFAGADNIQGLRSPGPDNLFLLRHFGGGGTGPNLSVGYCRTDRFNEETRLPMYANNSQWQKPNFHLTSGRASRGPFSIYGSLRRISNWSNGVGPVRRSEFIPVIERIASLHQGLRQSFPLEYYRMLLTLSGQQRIDAMREARMREARRPRSKVTPVIRSKVTPVSRR